MLWGVSVTPPMKHLVPGFFILFNRPAGDCVMPAKKVKVLCKTNKEALRWCKSRGAVIEFNNWRTRIGFSSIPKGITCLISITKTKKGEKIDFSPWEMIDQTLMKTVNKWIKKIDKIKK
jgi:hypothetical protein